MKGLIIRQMKDIVSTTTTTQRKQNETIIYTMGIQASSTTQTVFANQILGVDVFSSAFRIPAYLYIIAKELIYGIAPL